MTVDRQNPIRRAREAAGLSTEGLAFKAGVSLRTIERIEAGSVEPRRATLKVIADVLATKPDALVSSDPDLPEAA